jgi:hypothetical protein
MLERVNQSLLVLGLLALGTATWLVARPSAQANGCASSAPSRPAGASAKPGPHAYFESLVARPDCMAAYSLRDNAQLAKYTHGPNRIEQRVTYEPEKDTDPRRQDAAKVFVPAGDVSLRSTVRLPIGTTDGTSTLVIWDAWFGSEFRFSNTGIGNYKTFQFASPANRIWFELRTRFKQAESGRKGRGGVIGGGGGSDAVGELDVRAYGAKGTALGPNVERGGPLTPRAGVFTVRAETWTRYWVLLEQNANDWDPVSLWVADEDTDPVQIIDRRQLNIKKSVEQFWIQYNTSTQSTKGLGARTSYVRNVVMLRNINDVRSVLQKPVK